MTAPSKQLCRWVVKHACQAPSVYNTQPWAWRIQPPGRIDLYADRTRGLPLTDPDGRELVISCGAALHHAQVAARAAGMTVDLRRVPDPDDSDWLATLQLGPGRLEPAAEAALQTLGRRRTDRRRFTAWPIPEERIKRLAGEESDCDVELVPLLARDQRDRVEALLAEAMCRQRDDARLVEEQQAWVDRNDDEGVPSATAPPVVRGPHRLRSRFTPADAGPAEPQRPSRPAPALPEVDPTEALLVLATHHEALVDWLKAGEVLSRLWLRTTSEGLSLVPLSQVAEVPCTRHALAEAIAGRLVPQLLVRVGWQPIVRPPLPASRRRPVDEVLAASRRGRERP